MGHLIKTLVMSWRAKVQFSDREGIFLFATMSRLVLWSTQPSKLILEVLSLGVNDHSMKLNSHLHLVPRLRTHFTYTVPYALKVWCLCTGRIYTSMVWQKTEREMNFIHTTSIISQYEETLNTKLSL